MTHSAIACRLADLGDAGDLGGFAIS